MIHDFFNDQALLFFQNGDGDGDAYAIMFWGFLAGSVISFIITITFENPVLHLNIKDTLLTLGHGFGVAGAYVTLDLFSKYATSTIIAMVKPLTLVVFLACQYSILKHIQPGHQNIGEVLGVILVVIGNILAAFSQNNNKNS